MASCRAPAPMRTSSSMMPKARSLRNAFTRSPRSAFTDPAFSRVYFQRARPPRSGDHGGHAEPQFERHRDQLAFHGALNQRVFDLQGDEAASSRATRRASAPGSLSTRAYRRKPIVADLADGTRSSSARIVSSIGVKASQQCIQ